MTRKAPRHASSCLGVTQVLARLAPVQDFFRLFNSANWCRFTGSTLPCTITTFPASLPLKSPSDLAASASYIFHAAMNLPTPSVSVRGFGHAPPPPPQREMNLFVDLPGHFDSHTSINRVYAVEVCTLVSVLTSNTIREKIPQTSTMTYTI